MSCNEQTLKSRLETAKAALDTPPSGCVTLVNGQHTGTITLSGSNTYGGVTTLLAGTLSIPEERLEKLRSSIVVRPSATIVTTTSSTPVRPT